MSLISTRKHYQLISFKSFVLTYSPASQLPRRMCEILLSSFKKFEYEFHEWTDECYDLLIFTVITFRFMIFPFSLQFVFYYCMQYVCLFSLYDVHRYKMSKSIWVANINGHVLHDICSLGCYLSSISILVKSDRPFLRIIDIVLTMQ